MKPQQFSQLNLLSQHQAKHRTSGTTLVAQRTGTAQVGCITIGIPSSVMQGTVSWAS